MAGEEIGRRACPVREHIRAYNGSHCSLTGREARARLLLWHLQEPKIATTLGANSHHFGRK